MSELEVVGLTAGGTTGGGITGGGGGGGGGTTVRGLYSEKSYEKGTGKLKLNIKILLVLNILRETTLKESKHFNATY